MLPRTGAKNVLRGAKKGVRGQKSPSEIQGQTPKPQKPEISPDYLTEHQKSRIV